MPIARELYSAFSAQCSRWHYDTYDTSFSTFRLARGQAGTFGLIFPACPRESKSSEITVISVTLSSRSRLLPNQKSKTYGAKVSHLRRKSQSLTPRNPLAYEPQSNHKALKNQTSLTFRSDTKQGMKRGLRTPEQGKSMKKYEQLWASMSNCELPPHRFRIFALWFRDTQRFQSAKPAKTIDGTGTSISKL